MTGTIPSAIPIPNAPISGDAARRAAEAELKHAEYHRDDPGIVHRILTWIGDRLDSVVSGTPSGSVTIILLILLVAVIAFAVIRAGRPGRTARARRAAGDPLAPDARIDHRRLAAEYERDGRLAESLREWLRATIETIENRGILDPRPGRTGAGLAREAGAVLPDLAGELDAVVDAFDAIWFGRRRAGVEDVARAHRIADAVRGARISAGARMP